MGVTLRFTLPGSDEDVLELDAALQEQHSITASVTQFPVETGTNIADHVRQEPDRVRVDGIVSNTPLPSKIGISRAAFDERANAGDFALRAQTAYTQLRALKEGGIAVSISTELADYYPMVLLSLDVPRDAETGDVLRFMAEFEKVTQVSTRSVAVELKRSPKPGVVKTGTQPKKQVEEVQSRPDSGLRAAKRATFGD
jgi:hypothetical protein